jgi:maltodextrin utilization protein YvdJ
MTQKSHGMRFHNACPRGAAPLNDANASRHMSTRNGAYVALMVTAILATMLLMMPLTAHAASDATTDSTSATGDAYQLYDTRARTQQVTVNKVWDDGLSNDDRKSGSTSYQSLMSVSIMTGVPQSALRTYSIKFDANGGSKTLCLSSRLLLASL